MSGDKPGRTLQIAMKHGAIAVTVVACGSAVVLPAKRKDPGSGGMGGTANVGGEGGDGGIEFTTVGSGGMGGTGPCEFGFPPDTVTIEVPPEGVPADAGQICAVMMGPVESNNAARVTLVKTAQDLTQAKGFITIDPTLLPDVTGLPTVEVAQAPFYPQLDAMTVSNMTPNAEGFEFDASWPSLNLQAESFESMMIVRTRFDLMCGPNQTQQVEALTHINLCIDDEYNEQWMSSGDECTICGIIAEMAPSPIVPDKPADDVGLGRVIKLRLVIVAQMRGSLVLLAEHDAGAGMEYDWVASAGEVERVAPDVVLWTPPAEGGPHVIQVAVHDDDAAAVASFTNVLVRDAGLVA